MFKYFKKIRIDLDLQTHCKDQTESSHMPYTQFPLLLTFCISIVHLSQLMDQCDIVLTEVHTLFLFP